MRYSDVCFRHGAESQGFLAAIRFWLLAVPAFKQAKSSGGVLFCEVKLVGGFHHTLTIWKTKKDMRKFVLSPIHIRAMKIFPRSPKVQQLVMKPIKCQAGMRRFRYGGNQPSITIDF